MQPLKMLIIVACLMVLCQAALAFAGVSDQTDMVPELTVRGAAILQVPADQMRLTVGVVSHGATAEAALNDNTEKMVQVEKTLQRLGLSKAEYSTGFFQIEPKWQPRPSNASWDWKPGIAGYVARNSFKLKSRQLKLTGKIIEAVASAGANDIQALIFDLADPRHSRAEAITQATANARADAATLAAAAGVDLVRVRSLRLDSNPTLPMQMEMRPMAMGMAASVPPPIAAGDVMVEAGVQLVYEIGQLAP